MGQFTLHRNANPRSQREVPYLLDVQSALLDAHSTRFDHRFQRYSSADSSLIRPAIPRSCDRGSRSAATPGLHCYAAVVGSVNGRARRLRNDSPLRVMR
jgi:hypothetical protein